jgi:chitin synthase
MAQRMPERVNPNNYGYDQRYTVDQNIYPQRSSLAPHQVNGAKDSYLADPYNYDKHQSIMIDPATVQNMLTLRQTRRYVPLTNGNLVVDIPVARKVLKFASGNTREFTHTRYTAVTCGADEFTSKGYVLRQQENETHTEIFIVVTMYNEDHLLFCKTMSALMKNIRYLCSLNSKNWGPDGWKKVVVCIVSDGRSKINRKVLDILGLMGVYQDGIMKDSVNDVPVAAHMFEYTTQMCISQDHGKETTIRGCESGFFPMQILFCLKEKNAKKVFLHNNS